MVNFLPRLLRNQEAASAIIFAAALPAVMGAAALAVDLGSLYLAERELQGIADAAAVAGVGRGGLAASQSAVLQTIEDSGIKRVALVELADGEYRPDKAVAVNARFDAASSNRNAARVTLKREVPLFFGSLIVGRNYSEVTASALATRTDMAGFILGTRIASINPGLANSVLSALAGRNLNLTSTDINRLRTSRIDVLRFAEALGRLQGMEGSTFGEIFATDVSMRLAAEALALATPDSDTRLLLLRIAANLNNASFTPGELLDLGLLATKTSDQGEVGVEVEAFSLLRAFLEASHGDTYEVTLNTSVVGLANVDIRLAGGVANQRSPWLTVQSAKDVTLRTAETRILVSARTETLDLLSASLDVPYYTELAPAEARLTNIVCALDGKSGGVYISAKPSIGKIAIADVELSKFDDFSSPLQLRRARLLRTSLLEITAFSRVDVGGNIASTMHFTPSDVANRVTKSVATRDPVAGVASSLVSNVDIDVRTLGLGIGLGGTASLVGSTLSLIAPPIDGVFVSLTQILGVGLGNADVTVDRLRCGTPTIVG